MADGTLRFDTEIDESGFQKGLKRIEQAAKGATQQTASDARDAAKQAEQAVSQATEEAGKEAEKAAKQVENALEEIQDAAEDAADAITDAAEDAGQNAAESVQDAVDNIVESVEEAGESAAEAVEDAMSDVADSVSDAAKDVGDSASDIGDSIGDGFEEGTDQASTAIDALAQALLAAGVTASVKAITDALMGCTQASMEFETAMAKVGTIADESQKPLGDMRNEILALSGETGKSVGELAEATYQAISASVATESAVDFVGTANKLAVGGFSDTTTAVDILTTAINAYGMSADDAAKISDVLITTQNLGKTSVAQLGASMGMVIPLAAAYNMDLEDLSASYALLTANGTQTAQATTYVKAALNELGSTSSVVGSTLKKKTGKTFAELMKEGNSLGDVLQVLADSVDGDTTAFNNMWSSSEAGVGMLSILNSGTSKYNSLVQAMEGSTGAATTAFEKMSETGEFAQQRFQNATENLKIAIGDELAPVLMELQQSGADAMEWATEFVKEHPEVVAAVTALAAALAVLAAALVVNQVSKAFEAFSAALLANPFGLVALALVSLTAATVAFGKVMKDRTSDAAKNRKAIEQCRKSYNNLKDSLEEHEETAKENIKSAETEAATYQTLSDKLYDLANKTSKTAAEKAQMSAMVDQLNEAMPELGLSIDETTGALNKEKSAVDAVIDSMKQQALASAYQEQVKQAATDVAEAETQLSEARKVYNGLLVESRNETQEYNKAMQDTGNMVESTSDIYDAHGVKQTELNERLQEQKKVVEGLEGTYSEAQEKLSEASEKAGEYKVTTEETNEAISDSATEMSEEVQKAYEDMKTSIQNNLKGVVNAYEDFSGGEEISAEDVVTHLQSAANGVDQWADNLITLAGRAGEGMTKEFFSYLVNLGPQSANLVKACTEMTKPQLQDAVAAYSESGGEAAEAYSEKFAAIITNWDSTGQEIVQKAGEVGEKSGKEHTEKAKSGIESGQKEVTEAAKKGGEEAGKESQKATADGIQQNSGQVSQAAGDSMKKAADTARTYRSSFESVGQSMSEGVAVGINRGSPFVQNAVNSVLQSAVNEAEKKIKKNSPSHVWRDEIGLSMAEGAAVGIERGEKIVNDSVVAMADSSLETAKDTLEIHSLSKVFKDEIGKHIVGGVIKGIEAEVPKLKKTMKKMSEEAVKAAGEVDAAKGGYSDAASAIMESITSGLDKRQELLVSKLDNKIDGYVDKVVKKYEKLAEDKKTEAGNTTDATQKKKLQEEAKKLRKNAKKIKNYANKYTSTFMDALKEGTEKAYSKIENDLDKKLDEIADKYQKAYDKIISFRDDMKKKMSEPANMYDLDTQLTQVERYQEGLKKLKDKIPESLMDQILGMDLNEADNFVEHLNAMSAEELAAYKEKWEQLQSSSETFSKDFFEQRLTDVKAGWTKEVEEAAKTAQEAAEEAGKKIAKSLIKSLNGEKETLKKSMRGIAKDMIEAFKKAFELGKSNKSAKSTKTSTNAKGTTTSGKTTAKKKKAKGTDDSELDLETLKANAASKKKIQKLAKKGRLSEVGKVLEALPTPFEDTEQKKAALQKLDPKLLASLDRFEQTVNQLGNFITVSNAGNASIGKLLEAASNQTIQLQAELHTTVDLDGRTVGKAVTPYVNENMNTIRNRQRRGS